MADLADAGPARSEDDPVGAFCHHDGVAVTLAGAAEGPLAGLRFAAADVFDVAGHVTGAGNPDWHRTHDAARATAPVIEHLVAAGAGLIGKTVTDELGYSVFGVNVHYGTPLNPATPDSIPGGASSGAAAATGAALTDFGIGVDAAGSVLVPAGLCGLYGFRGTPGVVPGDGVVVPAGPLASVGWLSRDPEVLWRVGDVLIPPHPEGVRPLRRIVLADDLWEAVDDEVLEAMVPEVGRLGLRLTLDHLPVLAPGGLTRWADALTTLLAQETWARHGAWLEAVNPTLALDVRLRLDAAAHLEDDEIADARAVRDEVRARLATVLDEDTVLAVPTTPEIAPLLESTQDELAAFRRRTAPLMCLAGLAGLPQATVPLVHLSEYPVGLSFIGATGTDRRLLDLAGTVTRPAT